MISKLQLQLISSPKMSNGKENGTIRFPRRTRDHFKLSGSSVLLGKGEYEILLLSKKAYKEDVIRLRNMIIQGKIEENEDHCIGFVTRGVRDRVNRKVGSSGPWITEGINQITVGADPEFGLIERDTAVLVRGSHVLEHHGEFGSDGPGVEVRPNPSTNHLEVIENMAKILRDPPEAAEKFKWIGGATYTDYNRVYWFGGHIHIGRPVQIENETAGPIYSRIADTLDGLLALPMVRFDTPKPWLRRSGCSEKYGVAGDIRSDYPEQDRFEYRVLSGLWMVHPVLATIVMGATKCVAETAYGRIAEKGYDSEWGARTSSKNGMLKTFGIKELGRIKTIVNGAKADAVTSDLLESWENNIRSLDRFDNYKPELEALIALSKADPFEIREGMNLNLKENWLSKRVLLPEASKPLRKALDAVKEKMQ